MFEKLRLKLAQTLRHSGPDSVEDLVAAAMSDLTGLTFRRAQAGPQRGGDASANGVVVEVKRYAGGIPRKRELLGEIVEAAGGDDGLEVWALASTAAIPSQLRDDLVRAGRLAGCHVALLDWAPASAPALLVLLASAPSVTLDWLTTNAPELVADVQRAFNTLRRRGVAISAETLRESILPAHASFSSMFVAIREAYLKALADPRAARTLFRQELTPLRAGRPHVERRVTLKDIKDRLATMTADDFLVIIGDEGVGKSWIAVDHWLNAAQDRLCLFMPSSYASHYQQDGAAGCIRKAIGEATGSAGGASGSRIDRMLERWRQGEGPKGRLLFVLDGLNERPSAPWVRIVRDLLAFLIPMEGRLIVTCRPRFWRRALAGKFAFSEYEEVEVDGFDEDEFADAMSQMGRHAEEIPEDLRGDLVNPRVFSLAMSVLEELSGGGIVTKERVLWEYWRRRSIERSDVVLSDEDFRFLIIEHAEEAWQAIRSEFPAARFDYPSDGHRWRIEGSADQVVADLSDIASGRFFQPSGDSHDRQYIFAPDALWYALGLRLAYAAFDFVSGASEPAQSREEVAALMEPISDMDVAADIAGAAFAVAALHPDMKRPLAALLLGELVDLRNKQNDNASTSRNRVLAFVDEVPTAYIDVVENVDDPWLVEALRRCLVRRGASRPKIVGALSRWLVHECSAGTHMPNADGAEAEVPVNLFALAVHVLGGLSRHAAPGLVPGPAEGRTNEDRLLGNWFAMLDATDAPPLLFDQPMPQADRWEPNEGGTEGFASNAHLRFILDQWAEISNEQPGDQPKALDEALFDRAWNLSLAPSLTAAAPVVCEHRLAQLHAEIVSNSDPGDSLANIIESRLFGLAREHRVEFLLQFTRSPDIEGPSLPPFSNLDLGEGVGLEHIRRALHAAEWPSLGWDRAGHLGFALEFLRRASDLELDDACARALAEIISDRTAPIAIRGFAIDIALQQSSSNVAEHLARGDWRPVDEAAFNLSLHGSDLLAMALGGAGAYPSLAARIASGALPTAVEHAHRDDLARVACDLEAELRKQTSNTQREGGPDRGYMRCLTRAASERLGIMLPGAVRGWCELLRAHLTRSPEDKELGDFAWSLLPGCAKANRDLAEGYLRFLIDWWVEGAAHDSLQVAVPHLWINRAMGMPRSPGVDLELERRSRPSSWWRIVGCSPRPPDGGQAAMWVKAVGSSVRPAMVSSVM